MIQLGFSERGTNSVERARHSPFLDSAVCYQCGSKEAVKMVEFCTQQVVHLFSVAIKAFITPLSFQCRICGSLFTGDFW